MGTKGEGSGDQLPPVHPLTYVCAKYVMKMLPTYYICCIYSNALKKTFTVEANTMNPDQTAPFIRVHTFCNIDYQKYRDRETMSCHGWREKG